MAIYDAELLAKVRTRTWANGVMVWVIKDGDCWIWQRGKTQHGYGDVRVRLASRTENYLVHRLMWMRDSGRLLLPDEQIDHLCQVASCVNPAHLQAVSGSENNRLRCSRGRKGGEVIKLATRGAIRPRFLRDGTQHFAVYFRDRIDGVPIYRSRTFKTEAEAESFNQTLGQRPITDLVAS